jgi:hypothetical protein
VNGPATGASRRLLADRPPCRPPRRPQLEVVDLLPYLAEVARRPFNPGVHLGWGLQPNERVLLCVDNWHDARCVEAAERTLADFGCQVTVQRTDRGEPRLLEGRDELELLPAMVHEGIAWHATWADMRRAGTYDKAIWGLGGTSLPVTPELLASEAHRLPYPVLEAIDRWTWDRVRGARQVRVTDPEGTELTMTISPDYFDAERTAYNPVAVRQWLGDRPTPWSTYLPGHVLAKPWFALPGDDARGVMAGTMNHIGPYPRIELEVRGGQVVDVAGSGAFADGLRTILADTCRVHYPEQPGPGLLHWWEAALGTNPKIARPADRWLEGWACALPERVRSGVLHLGFGTVIGSQVERRAAAAGLPVGHYHVHLYFPSVIVQTTAGSEEVVVDAGHLLALDAPEVRAVAAQYGDPDDLLTEAWVPAVPGINVAGDYLADYAADPVAWTRREAREGA